MNVASDFPRIAVLIVALSFPLSLSKFEAVAGDLIVPVQVLASSNAGSSDKRPIWHVETLRLGAKHFDPASGGNAPYGLLGYRAQLGACVVHDRRDPAVSRINYPRHAHYRDEPIEHPKPQGMWLSRVSDNRDAWIEFELPEVAPLGQIWIWNWNDSPEVGRRVKHVTLQTSTKTTDGGQLGSVDYNVTHDTLTLPDIGQSIGRKPDLIYKFPSGAKSRYVRLHHMRNFGPDDQLGLAEVFIFGPGEPTAAQEAQGESGDASGIHEPHWQLFLDDHAITRSTGFRRVLHRPRPRGVVLTPDKPWETFGVTPWYVGPRKSGGYECYYQTLWWQPGGGSVNRMAYAISDDGIQWTKPVLNLVEAPSEIIKREGYPLGSSGGAMSKANNLVPCGHPRDMFKFGNVRDPNKRYAIGLAFHRRQPVGFCRELPDFINDPDWREKIVDSGGFKPSHYNALEYWDDLHNEWVALRQAPNHPPVRCAGRYASPDLKKWSLNDYLYPDSGDSTDPRSFAEVYGLMGLHMEGQVLGMAFWFHGDRTHPDPELYQDGHRRHTTEEGLIGKSVALGVMEVRLVSSRDGGKTWDRTVSREPWIPHGAEHDSYDRQVRLDCPPLHVGDEDWFYATVVNADHGTQAGGYGGRAPIIKGALYTQKHNRYVSMRAGNDRQILITKPIKVTGKTLQLNVDSSRGEVRVGIGIDKVIPHKAGQWEFAATLPHYMVKDRWERTHLENGFHILDCDPIQADCIEYNVAWKDTKLDSLVGKTVRLYIMVRNADLYGFRFR